MNQEPNMKQIITERIQRIVASNSNTESDERLLTVLLRRTIAPHAVVTCGVVYLEGAGRPQSVPSIAKQLLDIINKEVAQ